MTQDIKSILPKTGMAIECIFETMGEIVAMSGEDNQEIKRLKAENVLLRGMISNMKNQLNAPWEGQK